jgi:hypothetical protein
VVMDPGSKSGSAGRSSVLNEEVASILGNHEILKYSTPIRLVSPSIA